MSKHSKATLIDHVQFADRVEGDFNATEGTEVLVTPHRVCAGGNSSVLLVIQALTLSMYPLATFAAFNL